MLLESNLSEGEFVWDVNGVLASGEMTAVKSHSFRTVIGDPNYESNLPEKYWLYNNYNCCMYLYLLWFPFMHKNKISSLPCYKYTEICTVFSPPSFI